MKALIVTLAAAALASACATTTPATNLVANDDASRRADIGRDLSPDALHDYARAKRNARTANGRH